MMMPRRSHLAGLLLAVSVGLVADGADGSDVSLKPLARLRAKLDTKHDVAKRTKTDAKSSPSKTDDVSETLAGIGELSATSTGIEGLLQALEESRQLKRQKFLEEYKLIEDYYDTVKSQDSGRPRLLQDGSEAAKSEGGLTGSANAAGASPEGGHWSADAERIWGESSKKLQAAWTSVVKWGRATWAKAADAFQNVQPWQMALIAIAGAVVFLIFSTWFLGCFVRMCFRCCCLKGARCCLCLLCPSRRSRNRRKALARMKRQRNSVPLPSLYMPSSGAVLSGGNGSGFHYLQPPDVAAPGGNGIPRYPATYCDVPFQPRQFYNSVR